MEMSTKRTSSWPISILSFRREIEDIQEEFPSLNRDFLDSIWDKCFQAARLAPWLN